MCNCGCQEKTSEMPPVREAEDKTYVCSQCNAFITVPASKPAPECCGKKMQDMD
jgi:predicted SprT family Zn-dependent metalloprotease